MTSDDTAPAPATAVVLCGGASRRFGTDKTRADLAGRSLLDHLLDGLPPGWPVICVGEARPTHRDVRWCREDPPGGGPVAAVAAALLLLDGPVLVLLGGDMPYAASPAPTLVATLERSPDVDAVIGRDGDGRLQPLLAAYRTSALRGAVPVGDQAAVDVDTAADLERARHRLDP